MTKEPQPPPRRIHPAATVVVMREHASDGGTTQLQVLLVRRNDSVAFMAGAHVFPGGRVDDGDADAVGLEGWIAGLDGRGSRFPDLDPKGEWTFRRAAARELIEEANVRVEPASLEPLSHWVTPEVEIRRYDTRFFLGRMPGGQEARHDAGETTGLQWVTPEDAILQCRDRRILLPPPTWTTLRELSGWSSIDAAMAWARGRTIVRIQPGFVKTDEVTMLTLPGDPLQPPIPGWDPPEETRFVLEEGHRWLPRRA